MGSLKVLLSTYQGIESDVKAIKCNNCGSGEHKAKKCPVVKANNVDGSKVETQDSKKLKKKQKEQFGKCPLCSEHHTYTKWQDKE